MKPSIGRIVHYVAYGTPGEEYPSGVCRAAVVTEINTLGTGLCVLNPSGQFFNQAVVEDQETKKAGTWHWPERVE